MNERIRELVKQAGGHYNSGNQHSWPQYTIDDPKKFAELIVRECITQINEAIPDTDCSASGAYKTAKIAAITRVKDHFGVE
jgi:hypothetical protein